MYRAALLLAAFYTISSHSALAKPPIEVTAIRVGQMEGDVDPAEFSVVMGIKANSPMSSPWQFGFYIPGTFYRLVTV